MHRLFSRNFILLILGQASSLFGNFILKLALSMYVLDLTGSAAVFAGILSAATIPTILLSPFGGILADRADKRKIMVASDALAGMAVLCTVLLLSVKISSQNTLIMIGGLLVLLSILGAFETPVVQACIPSMLEGDNIIRGNAVINQIASLAYLIAPMLGGALYAAFGLRPVMYASVVCFWATALFECFIRLDFQRIQNKEHVFKMIGRDFSESMQFLCKEQPGILKILLMTAFSRFFVMGITLVGLPFLVRNVLGFDAKYYGAAESALAIATIFGSIAAGVLTGKLKTGKWFLLLSLIGLSVVPAGIAFLLPIGNTVRYVVNIVSFCVMQTAISIFSVFAVSLIQQRTPGHLIGKVMAYTSAITLCAQPVGQLVYGFLFDSFADAVYFVLIPSSVLAGAIGLLAKGTFTDYEPAEPESHSGPQ